MSTELKYTHFDDGEGSSHTLVVGLVPDGARVLEFGCATGYMSEVLKSRKGCVVTGIEISPEAAALAREHCERVIVGDAEELDYDELLGKQRFEAILFADVLEHLKEPRELLQRIRPFLSRRGAVIASIPNIAHGSVRLALLAGEFRYRELGLLDNTHLRFFTHESTRDLFEAAGFVITNWLYTRNAIDRTEIRVPTLPLAEPIREWLQEDPNSAIYQFVVRAEASTATNQLADLRDKLAVASDQLLELENTRRAAEQATELRERAEQQATELRERAEQQATELRERAEQQARLIEGLRHRVRALGDQERQTYESLRDTQRQLLLSEQEVSRKENDISRTISHNESVVEQLQQQVDKLESELQAHRATRAWRLASKYWGIRDSLLRRHRSQP
jgi:O-antigen biosynthesis protein